MAVQPARAGTYGVTSCGQAPGSVNNSWSFTQTGTPDQLQAENECGGSGDAEFRGLYVRDRLGPPDSDTAVSGYWSFVAPTGTSVSGLTYRRYFKSTKQPWLVTLRDSSGASLESCLDTIEIEACTLGQPGGASSTATFAGLSTGRLEVGVRCARAEGEFCVNGGSQHHGEAVIYGATVTVDDPVAPTVGSPTGTLFGGGWVRGVRTAAVVGRDSTGVERLQLRRDGGVVVATDSRTCDFTFAAPCASPGADVASGWGPVDTAAWPDGSHEVVAAVRDAGGLEGVVARTVLTDNTAPIAPQGARAGDGRLWSSAASRQVEWTLPAGQASPIVSAAVTVCPTGGGACTPAAGPGLTSATVNLPAPGSYEARLVLTDEAGNTNPANVAVVPLGYDATPGPAPSLGAPARQGNTFVVPVPAANDPGPAPVARLQGEVCGAGGAACQPLAAQPRLDQVTATVTGPGTYTLRVQAVDAADNPGAFASTTLTVPGPEPTPAPSPTATPTPPQTTRLRLTRVRLTKRRVRLAGALSPDATGMVRVKVSARRRSATETVAVRAGGGFGATVKLPRRARGVRQVRMAVRYGGDATFRPRVLVRAVRR